MDRSLFIGLVCYLTSAAIDTIIQSASRVLKGMGWPFFRTYGTASVFAALIATVVLLIEGSRRPSHRAIKWVVLRAVFGGAAFTGDVVAVRLGTPPGDVASLSSINTMMAAILGRLILGESLGWLNFFAFLCCMVGVALIAKPAFLFGGEQSDPAIMFGYALALASGFSCACIFVVSRLLDKVSTLFMSAATSYAISLCFLLLPCTPLIEDAPVGVAIESLDWAAVFIVVFTAFALFTPLAFSKGAACCPAAVSATINTGVRMSLGYVAQVLFFGVPPDAITLTGAFAMLLSIMLTTARRTPTGSQSSSSSASNELAVGDSANAQPHGDFQDVVPQVPNVTSQTELIENIDFELHASQVTSHKSSSSGFSHLGSRNLAVFFATEFTKRVQSSSRRRTNAPAAQTIGSVVGAFGTRAGA